MTGKGAGGWRWGGGGPLRFLRWEHGEAAEGGERGLYYCLVALVIV